MKAFRKNFFRLSFKLLGRHGLKWIIISLIASVGISLVELSVSVVIQLLLMSFGILSTQTKISYLKFLPLPMPIAIITIILCITAAIRFIVQLTATQTSSYLNDYISHRLRTNTIQQMLFSDSLESRLSSAINFKISEVFVKASAFVFHAVLFLSMFTQSIFLFLIMFFISWKEAIFSIIGIAIIGFTVIYINKTVSKFAKLVPPEQQKLNSGIEKIARNFIFIKLMKKREDEFNTIHEAISEYSSKSLRAAFFSNFGAQAGPFLGILLLVCVILLSQNFWHTQPILLISFIYLLARFVQSLSILAGYFGNAVIFLPQYKIALESISNDNFEANCNSAKTSFFGLRHKSQLNPKRTTGEISQDNTSKCPNIIFKNMSFKYDNSKPIFQNLNLEVAAGLQIGIMGASGTGKSTLLMLLTGILKPTAGNILIDEIDADIYVSKEEIRIGYVGAEPFLISGSIKENLLYGLSLKVSDKDLIEILHMVSLSNLVKEKGLDYTIGEDHSGLSAGQKQRLCLARAILNKPNMLILDEATANLDEKNEHHIAEILKELKGKCTTIIVSHRPGILIHADQIIDMHTIVQPYK